MPTDPIDSAYGRPNIHDATGQGRTTPDRIWPATKRAIKEAGFKLMKPLSSGGSYDVWTARPTIEGKPLGTRLVVKVLVEPGDDTKRELFKREVKILNSEKLPRDVVPTLHYHRQPTDRDDRELQPFLVMEEIDGEAILKCAKSLGTIESKLMLIAVAFEALGRIHDHDIRHGDISHNNLFVETSGRVRVIDFGGSKAVNQVGTQSVSIHVGTMHCAPPSYLLGHATLEAWVDIHALGSVAFQILAEAWPDKRAQGPDRNRSRLRDRGVPEQVVETILKCLSEKEQGQTDREKLYSSPKLVADEIRAYLKRREILALRRRQSLATVCVMLPLLAVTSIGWWFWWTGERDARAREVDTLQRRIEGLSDAGHPVVKDLAAKAQTLLGQRDEALKKGETFAADALSKTLIANLTRQIAVRQGLERCRPYLKSLGETLNRTPWILEAPTIAAGRANLDRDYLAIGSRLERGETNEAWRELGLFHEALVKLSEVNLAASDVVEARSGWKRAEAGLSARLRDLAKGDATFAEAVKFGGDGESSWTEGKWTEAKRDFGLARGKLDTWLTGKETPEELAARRQADRESLEDALKREQKLKDQIAGLEKRLEEIGKLQGQITELNALNLADRATAKAAMENLGKESALRKAAESKRDEYLAASGKYQQDLLAERAARATLEGELTALRTKSQTEARKSAETEDRLKTALLKAETRVSEAELREAFLKSFDRENKAELEALKVELAKLKAVSPTRNAADWVGTNAGDRKFVEFRGQKIAFRWCPPGSFQMGPPPGVRVNLTQGFWMMETELTQGLWTAAEGPELDWSKWGKGPNHPVYNVSHDQAVAFIAKLNQLLHEEVKSFPADVQLALPTEAQWEYAYRAGTSSVYFFGDDASKLGDYAWYGNLTGGKHPVATKQPNPWGLHDMAGSLWEWTADLYASDLAGGDNPGGPAAGASRVSRGGCWSSTAEGCAAAFRYSDSPVSSYCILGFRLLAVPLTSRDK